MSIALLQRLAALRNDRLAAHLSQASAVSMSVRVIGLAMAFLSHLLLSRTLGASQYGSYVIAVGWAMVLVIPARLGLDSSVLRYATVYREDRRASDLRGLVIYSLKIIGLLSLLIAAALLLSKAAGVAPLRSIGWPLLAGVALLVPFSAALGWFSALIRTANRVFASQFYEQVLRPSLLIAMLALLALIGRRPGAAEAMLITVFTVGAAMVGIAIHSKAAFAALPPVRASFEHRREWLSIGWITFLTGIILELLNQIELILLGILADATAAAHFAAAWRLAALVPFGLIAISTVSGPMIASAHNREDIAELARIARLNARFSTLFAAIIAPSVALLGKPALGLFGPGFADAYPVLLILLVGGVVNSFTGSVGYLLTMTGNQRGALVIMTGALVVSVIANLLLIPSLGATGAAIASTLGIAAWNLVMAAYVRRKLGVDATALGMPARAA